MLRHLEHTGRLADTLIVFTSDHGDYFGDHWLGEKELFHEPSARIPLLVYDPDPAADATRGTTDDRFVEAIDIVPTILEAMGVAASGSRIEGRSLVGTLRGAAPASWRDAAFSEIDYAFYAARKPLGLAPNAARAYMIRSERWKYVHYKGFRPQLFDMANDPGEQVDLGASAAHAGVRAELQAILLDRLTDRRNRVTMSDAMVDARTDASARIGIHIGRW